MKYLKKSNSKNLCYLLGDMNVNLLNYENSKSVQDYVDTLHGYGFHSCINRPTRLTRQSASIIDHIWSNDYTNNINPGILITDVTDHFLPFNICSKITEEALQRTFIYTV